MGNPVTITELYWRDPMSSPIPDRRVLGWRSTHAEAVAVIARRDGGWYTIPGSASFEPDLVEGIIQPGENPFYDAYY